MLYSLQHRLSRDGNSAGPVGAPKYDIFVSYDSSDSQWVLDTLRPELEERRGLTLCLHERDFTPGKSVVGKKKKMSVEESQVTQHNARHRVSKLLTFPHISSTSGYTTASKTGS